MACRRCELFFIDPYPVMEDAHEKVKTFSFSEHKVISPEVHLRAELTENTRLLPWILEVCKNGRSHLDIGCGCGTVLKGLAERGARCVGVELNQDRAAFARRNARCEIIEKPIELYASPTRFDSVSMINVLSHIPSFDGLFQSVKSLLVPRGSFVVKVGEHAPDAQVTDVFDWQVPDHMHFLGLGTIDFICGKYGFEKVEHRRVPFAEEFFTRDKWLTPGRSALRNALKTTAAHTPGALAILRRLYERKHARRVFSSYIVLSPK
jgi:cyclopropane fatty-acyl-phospholipid synthase-like methyltransferase